MNIKGFFLDILTEDNNHTFCLARSCTLLACLTFCAISILHVVKGMPVNLSDFGVGFGALLGGGGVLIGGKAATQKEPS